VGHLVSYCEEKNLDLHEVSDSELASLSAELTPDVRDVMNVAASLARKAGIGGTAPHRVAQQRDELQQLLVRLSKK